MTNKFEALGLSPELVKAVGDLGFENPSEVQEAVIPKQLSERSDIVCLAQTGTGKTAAFGLPLIQAIDADEHYTQALVLCPTRELCRQIAEDLTKYSRYVKNIAIATVYGGASIDTQVRALRKGAHIIVATPGRMVDLLERRVANLSGVNRLILDEADEMLNMGFKEELDTIISYCSKDRSTLLFSATLPREVESIARNYMKNPETITVGKRNVATSSVKHYYYMVNARDRYRALKRIADYNPDIYGIVFCRTRYETKDIADALVKDGYNADALHGDLSQAQRDMVMGRFKGKTLSILVATDVAARGIDVNDLTHVINYNLPDEVEQYTHRSGRTGRAGKTGISIVIINSKEQSKIPRIEKVIGQKFAKANVPTGKEVCSKKLFHLLDQIEQAEVKEDINEYLQVIESKWEYMSKTEIIQKVISVEFNRFLEYYKFAPDINVLEPERRREKERSSTPGRATSSGYEWLNINIGSRSGATPRHLIRLLSSCGIGKRGVGKIEFRRDFSLVEVSSKSARSIIAQLDGTNYKGLRLTIRQG